MPAKSKIQRNYYQDVQCGLIFAGRTSSVPLIAPTNNRRVRSSLYTCLTSKSCVKRTCWDTRSTDSIIKSGQKDTEASTQSACKKCQRRKVSVTMSEFFPFVWSFCRAHFCFKVAFHLRKFEFKVYSNVHLNVHNF